MAREAERVKGTLVQGVVAALRELVASGAIDGCSLRERLPEPALRLMEIDPAIAGWYPVEGYRALLDLFWEAAGNRSPEFIEEAGRAAGRAVAESHLYRGYLDAGRRRDSSTIEGLVANAGAAVRMTDLLYDFVEVEADHDAAANELVFEYRGVGAFSDAMFLGTRGFLEEVACQVLDLGREGWRASRPAKDLFRISYALPAPDPAPAG